MKFPWSNVALLIILVTLTVSGYLGLVNGHEDAAWRLWVHGIAAYALIVLFVWKSRVILDAFIRKKKWTRGRVAFSVMLILLLVTVLMGLLWTFNGPIHLGGFSLVSLHIYVAVPVMLLLVWHVRRMKFIFKVKGTLDRRLFLGTAVSSLIGALLWRFSDVGKTAVGLEGAKRRFTGSYERGSFTGQFPSVSWIFDYPDLVNKEEWQLLVDGAVARPLSLSYSELLVRPTVEQEVLLDCTSGWYTTQVWQGVPLKQLLDEAGVLDTAVSVTIEAVSHYKRRFALADCDHFLLATHAAGVPLAHGHGAPLRLVAPQLRGYDWVKWVTRIHVNTTSAIWQSPLPLG
ncbi:MAG: molybdopterin-dependent oxidoreductase [Anaerolineaceae bacterium]|nr:molybdopterin-dependent oxidoreductase [Anaerolineaceae bacterium]